MFTRHLRALALGVLIVAPVLALRAQVPSASDRPKYVLPPQHIVDVFDAEPLPQTLLSPNRQVLAVVKARSYPTIAELSQPMLRLAGLRVNPKTNGPHRDSGLDGTGIYSITLKKIADGAEMTVTMPLQPRISNVKFSPDGSRLSFTNTKDGGIELWVADTATGRARVVTGTDRLNATADDPDTRDDPARRHDPCDWLRDDVTVVCTLVPAGRGPAPAEPTVPSGPNVHENYGKPSPAPTYEDLLKSAYDDALFEYYFTSQLATINTSTATKTAIGRPAILGNVTPSPNGQYVLVTRVKKPFSHLIPMSGIAQSVEIWSRAGEVARTIADVPSREGVSLTAWRRDRAALSGAPISPRPSCGSKRSTVAISETKCRSATR